MTMALLSRGGAVVVVALLATAASSSRVQQHDAPYNGAPFLKDQPLGELPSQIQDEEDPNVSVTRLLPNTVNSKDASSCTMGDQAAKGGCLNQKMLDGRECMWVRVESRNPLLAIQNSFSYCLPCMMDDEEIPCWNVGAWVGGNQVTDCEMRCPHQKLIRQPEYACSDESGFITNSQCFDKGARSQSKCMFIAYETEDGGAKSTCGPCYVSGTGGWGCPATGGPGPEGGSKVTFCLSMCDSICAGPPDCPPTVAPPPPPPPPSPGIMTVNAAPNEMLKAPLPIAMPTINPYAVAAAAQAAAKAAGWEIGTPPPPTGYYPVIMYRKPGDYMFTPGPPPSSIAYPAPGAAAAMLQTDPEDENGPEQPMQPPPPPPPPPAQMSFLTKKSAMHRWGSR